VGAQGQARRTQLNQNFLPVALIPNGFKTFEVSSYNAWPVPGPELAVSGLQCVSV
jgi:hypothetical protein